MHLKNIIICIGPKLSNGIAGGVTLPFHNFVQYLSVLNENSTIKVIEYGSHPAEILNLLCKLLFLPSNSIVIANATWRASLLISPILAIIKPFKKQKLVFRKFAGDFDIRTSKLRRLEREILLKSLKAFDFVYLETEYLVYWARSCKLNAFWWPNSRKAEMKPNTTAINRISKMDSKLRLVFIGRVCNEKGFFRIVEIAKKIGGVSGIDVWGPIAGNEHKSVIKHFEENSQFLKYKGVLHPDRVIDELANYDYLILPSTWQSEGYPGVVIEAGLVGVPTIATESRGPSELIRLLGYGITLNTNDLKNRNEIVLPDITHDERLRLSARTSELFSDSVVFPRILAEIGVKHEH